MRFKQRYIVLISEFGGHALDMSLRFLFYANIGQVLARVDLCVLLFTGALLLSDLKPLDAAVQK